MNKPTLVIMAAGMGSRYGGLKQIDPIDEQGHIIMDFSIFDAVRAGFEKVVFVIKKENEKDFRETIGNRMEKQVEVAYAFQRLEDIPEGFEVPEGRVKPFGTGQAVLAARDVVDGPFAVVNADDYYGSSAYRMMYEYLTTHQDDEKYRFAMVGYILENTLTENGHVARGICTIDENSFLTDIHERTRIEKHGEGAAYTEDEGKTWTDIPKGSLASMNMWGFSRSMMDELEKGFPRFLKENLPVNPLKCEYFLPFAVDDLLKEGKASVQVLKTEDKWYGVTYKEDKPMVVKAIQSLKDAGLYPQNLWNER
ncbi:MAG: sugar phosphate nucleotidyltransferase [Eubacteriales bacterium]|nr:sugar phosphate nucleotidyltransferase [Eubacteriales bacterium]